MNFGKLMFVFVALLVCALPHRIACADTLTQILQSNGTFFVGTLTAPKSISPDGHQRIKKYLASDVVDKGTSRQLNEETKEILCKSLTFSSDFGLGGPQGCSIGGRDDGQYFLSITVASASHDQAVYRQSGKQLIKTVVTVPVYLDISSLTPQKELRSNYSQLVVGEVIAQDPSPPPDRQLQQYYLQAFRLALRRHLQTAASNSEMPFGIRGGDLVQVSSVSISNSAKTTIEKDVHDIDLLKDEVAYSLYQGLVSNSISKRIKTLFIMPPEKSAAASAIERQATQEIATRAGKVVSVADSFNNSELFYEVRGVVLAAESVLV
ncbi:MAG: hypothetical protein AAB276_07145, partial [Pseudomonadota bacterium]